MNAASTAHTTIVRSISSESVAYYTPLIAALFEAFVAYELHMRRLITTNANLLPDAYELLVFGSTGAAPDRDLDGDGYDQIA